MPPRQCLYCPRPAIAGRFRCSIHGPTSPRGPSPYGGLHQQLAKRALAGATVCAICGLPPTPDNPLQADHILPLSMGGQMIASNYQAAHRRCNIRKGGRNRKPKGGGGFSRG